MSRKRLIITAIVLVLVLAIGGILAYFTDSQTVENTFKMSNVDIEVKEPGFPNETITIGPNDFVTKNPYIENKSSGNVYAFMEVAIPVANVATESNPTVTERELFKVQHITSEEGVTPVTYDNGINSGWVKIEGPTAKTIDEVKYNVYVYAYATSSTDQATSETTTTLTELGYQQGANTTSTIFDGVQFIDAKEVARDSSVLQDKDWKVIVTGHGIQTTGLGLDNITPEAVWNLVKTNVVVGR